MLKNLFKKPSFYIITVIALLIIGGTVNYFIQKNKPAQLDSYTATRQTIIQEVNVTGIVKPASSVDLAFEKSGRVSAVTAQIGDTVKMGQVLVSLSSADLGAQLQQANASLLSARAQLNNYEAALSAQNSKLEEMKKGTRQEELNIAETSVSTQQKNLADSKIALENARTKATADLNQRLNNTASSLGNSINVGLTAIFAINDIQGTYFVENTNEGARLADAKAMAIETLLGQSGAGYWSSSALNNLNGGAKLLVTNLGQAPTETQTIEALQKTKLALQQIKLALSSINITKLSATAITSISTQKTYTDAELQSVITNEQLISVQKATNKTAIDTATSTVASYENAVRAAEDQLNLKLAGYTMEQLSAQESLVRQAQAGVDSQRAQISYAEANVRNYQAQLSKNVLVSPIDGVVTAQDAKVGQIIAPSTIIVKIISVAKFEIEANIAEVDIANIKLGDTARVTLDAYGDSNQFKAIVTKLNPAEIIIDGVPTYKATLQFSEDNEIIKSGMTANLDIETARRDNAISIPQRTVLTKDNQKIVRIVNPDNTSYQEVGVKTGIRGVDGNIEILEGVAEGQKVVTAIKK